MKTVIVTTTINQPTEAIEKFQSMKDCELVVIGDKKTPADYHLDRGIYVTPEEQEKYDPELSEAIGWNCIQRRSMGLLWAHDMKADIVAVVDDDNIPLDGWGEHLLVGRDVEMDCYETELPAFDSVGATNYPRSLASWLSASIAAEAGLLEESAEDGSRGCAGGLLERRPGH